MHTKRRQAGSLILRIVFAVLILGVFYRANAAVSSVQTVAKATSVSGSSFSLGFPANTAAGDVILVGFDFDSGTPLSVTDSQGNAYVEVGSQLTSPGGARSRVYYAKSIRGGADTVTVNMTGSFAWMELYATEYSGANSANPIDGQAGAAGNAGTVSSGSVTTTAAGDVIYGYCVADATCNAGQGLTVRSTLNNNLIEDKTTGNAGAYAATGTANNGWTMQLVALKPVSLVDVTAPSVPANLSAKAASPSQINVSWSASTDNVGVSGYRIFRNGAQIATTGVTSYSDSGLSASTTYSYTVAAYDAAGNVSAQSAAAVATTLSSSDTTPPSAPTNVSGGSPVSTQVNLSWSASTDNVGVSGYHVLRNGTQVGTVTATSYSDTGLIASTAYTYTVTAFDAAGNVSAPSSPFVITTASASTSSVYPLKLSGNGKYLVDQTNKPFFIVGDAPQAIAVSLSNSDVATYLADRQARGFNALWVIAIDQGDQPGAPKDFNGDPPFNGAWYTNENAAYWAHEDSVIQAAGTAGMTVFLNISFIGNSGEPYDFNSIQASSDAVVTAYGAFVGNRYKSFPNIVYLLGGDTDLSTPGLAGKIADLYNGLRSADTTHLITFEACRNTCTPAQQSTVQAFGGSLPAGYGINWVYNNQSSVVTGCQSGYAASGSSLPPMMGEDTYELDGGLSGFQIRQEGYWEILSGCYLGRLFGNGALWNFNSPGGGHTTPSWQSQLSSTGSVGEQYMGALMNSREHWLMAPDTAHRALTAGYGSGSTLSVAARTIDGQTIVAYFSDGNATAKTINMSQITSASSTAKAWWYNPQTGVATAIPGTFPTSGSQMFTAPDGNDWVLVVDDASAGLPAPGSGVMSTDPPAQVATLICSPTTLTSGASATCTVALSQPAAAGGAVITLTNNNPGALSAPASVTVAASASTATFSVTASTFTVSQSATVTATLGTSSVGTSLSLQVSASALLSSLVCAPTTLTSGASATCTVTLSQAAPAGGAVVTLTDSNSSVLSVPASITVAPNASTATFSATASTLTVSQSVTVTATLGTSSIGASLSLQGPVLLTSLACSPTTLAAGTASTCTVTLNRSAAPGGAVVSITNNNSGAITVPSSVTVTAGSSTATFSATAVMLMTSQSAIVTATLGTSSSSITFSVYYVDTIPPTVSILSPVAGQTVSGTISLSASASDNVGVAKLQFTVDGLAVGAQITAPPFTYSLVTTTLANGTHTIAAVATDFSGNTATSVSISVTVNNASKPISFVQTVAKSTSVSSNSFSLGFPANTAAGDVILVGFDFDNGSTPLSVTDSQGNAYVEVGTQLTSPGGARGRVYFAKSIKGGADTVTINMTGNFAWMELYITEYSGANSANPIDGQAGAAGNAGTVSSGSVTTTAAGDVIYGYCVADATCNTGQGLTARSTLNNNLIEDKTTGNAGAYAATGTANNGWTMQLVALKK